MKKVIINATTSERRIAIMENNQVVEFHIQQPGHQEIVGNIYSGRVVNVLPGMQAAFVDIGIKKNGFIHRDQLLSYQLKSIQDGGVQQRSISEFVHEGEEILVQVVKEGVGNKGPKLTGIIEIPGTSIIYLPHGNYVAVSRKMKNEAIRENWRDFGNDVCQSPEGLIIRTVCEYQKNDILLNELDFLRKRFESILKKKQRSATPGLLFQESDIVERVIREIPHEEISEIVVDHFEMFRQIQKRFSVNESTTPETTFYSRKENIFTNFELDHELEKALKRIVWLRNGAYIIIEHTEALTVIDVNTGKFAGKTSLRETVLNTNIEAAKEISRQLRLRDIGGMILVDFIDMKTNQDQIKVTQTMKNALKSDRTRTRIVGFTELGILQLTRKKARQSLETTLTEYCPECEGRGRVMSSETIAYKAERELWEYQGMDHEALWLETIQPVLTCLAGKNNEHLTKLEEALKFRIYVTENNQLKTYHIRQIGTRENIEARMNAIKNN